MNNLPPEPLKGSVMEGILFGFMAACAGSALLLFLVVAINLEWGYFPLFNPGVTQLLWIVPLIVVFRRSGKPRDSERAYHCRRGHRNAERRLLGAPDELQDRWVEELWLKNNQSWVHPPLPPPNVGSVERVC